MLNLYLRTIQYSLTQNDGQKNNKGETKKLYTLQKKVGVDMIVNG